MRNFSKSNFRVFSEIFWKWIVLGPGSTHLHEWIAQVIAQALAQVGGSLAQVIAQVEAGKKKLRKSFKKFNKSKWNLEKFVVTHKKKLHISRVWTQEFFFSKIHGYSNHKCLRFEQKKARKILFFYFLSQDSDAESAKNQFHLVELRLELYKWNIFRKCRTFILNLA